MARIWNHPPFGNFFPDTINNGGRVVLLKLRRQTFSFVENQTRLITWLFPFSWLGDRRYKFSQPPFFNDFLRGLSLTIQFPMLFRVFVRVIKYWMFEESVRHNWLNKMEAVQRFTTLLSIQT